MLHNLALYTALQSNYMASLQTVGRSSQSQKGNGFIQLVLQEAEHEDGAGQEGGRALPGCGQEDWCGQLW